MPSLQYRAYLPLMRLARWQQSKFLVHDPGVIIRFRRITNGIVNAIVRLPRHVKIEHASLGSVPGDWIIPPGAPDDPMMLFLHGGGIAFGWNNPMRREVAYIAKFAGLRAFSVDYSIIPEHVYPTAHDECFAVYRSLVERRKQIVLIGESSGAVLALAILLRAEAAGLPQPLLCALISPVVDFGFKDVRIWANEDPFAHPRFVVELHKHYITGADETLPDLCPVDAGLEGIASLYVLAGEKEIMRSEVDRLQEAAIRHGVPFETLFWPGGWHSWHALVPQMPEAVQALQAFAKGIRERIPGNKPSDEENYGK